MRVLAGIGVLAAIATGTAASASTVYVGIAPLRPIVSEILGESHRIEVLLPPGASPETYEPQGRRLADLADADVLFVVGLPFEELIAERLERAGTARQVVHLVEDTVAPTAHPWLDPMELSAMAEHCANWALQRPGVDRQRITAALEALRSRMEALDGEIETQLEGASPRAFLTLHPAYDAFARRYGFEQIAIEVDGRLPTGRSLVSLLERARTEGVRTLLTQPQHTARQARAIVRELELRSVSVDPLQEDVADCLRQLVAALRADSDSR